MKIHTSDTLNYDIFVDEDGHISVYTGKGINVTENIKQLTQELIIENIPTIMNVVKVYDKYKRIEQLQKEVDTLEKQIQNLEDKCRALLNGNI